MSTGSRVKYVPRDEVCAATAGDSALVRSHKREKETLLRKTGRLLERNDALMEYVQGTLHELHDVRDQAQRRAVETESAITIARRREAFMTAELVSTKAALAETNEALAALKAERSRARKELSDYLKGLLLNPDPAQRTEFGMAYNAMPVEGPKAMTLLYPEWENVMAATQAKKQ